MKTMKAFLLVVLAVLALGYQGEAKPAGTQLVYLHSGLPAFGLRLTIEGGSAPSRIVASDAAGRIPAIAAGSVVTITDPSTRLALMRFSVPRRVPQRVLVPEPIRMKATVAGSEDYLRTITIQYGFGSRITANERFRQDYDRLIGPSPGENVVFGTPMPKSSPEWVYTCVGAQSQFVTGWIPATDTPQVLLYTRAGDVLLRDVALPKNIQPRDTIDLGRLELLPSRHIQLDIDAPETAVQSDYLIYLRSAQIASEDRQQVARYLSVLDRIAPRIFAFLTQARPLAAARGSSQIVYIPRFERFRLRIAPAIAPGTVEQVVDVSSGSATVSVKAAELSAAEAATEPLDGVVLREGTQAPVPGARIVYSAPPEKIEVTADAQGRFHFPNVATSRSITLYATTPAGVRPPSSARLDLVRDPGANTPVTIVLPTERMRAWSPFAAPKQPRLSLSAAGIEAGRAKQGPYLSPFSAAPLAARTATANLQSELFFTDDEYENCIVDVFSKIFGDEIPVDVTDAQWVSIPEGKISVTIAQSGTYDVRLAVGPLLAYAAEGISFTANQPKVLTLTPVAPFVHNALVTYFRYAGFAAPVQEGTGVYYSSAATEMDPLQEDANYQGVTTLGVIDYTLYIYVNDRDMGYFSGFLNLSPFNYYGTVFLQAPPN